LAATDPVTAAAALAARIGVHAGSLSLPATPTSAWALSTERQPCDDLAEAAVYLLAMGA
jgi:hypothetical protein